MFLVNPTHQVLQPKLSYESNINPDYTFQVFYYKGFLFKLS